jgi:hypothetical protein
VCDGLVQGSSTPDVQRVVSPVLLRPSCYIVSKRCACTFAFRKSLSECAQNRRLRAKAMLLTFPSTRARHALTAHAHVAAFLHDVLDLCAIFRDADACLASRTCNLMQTSARLLVIEPVAQHGQQQDTSNSCRFYLPSRCDDLHQLQ